MKTPPPPKANRNDPCPCGSGKKFKHCCLGKVETKARSMRTPLRVVGFGVLILAGVVVANRPTAPSRSQPPAAASASGSTSSMPLGTPAPWQYDPVSNRHWDPGHGHWHDGPPPRQPGATEVSTTTTFSSNATNPPAWFFDAAANRHWHPDHQHWHDGPPPNASAAASTDSTAGWDIVIEPDGDLFDDFRLPRVLP